MRSSFRNPSRIAIAILAVLFCIVAAHACTQSLPVQAPVNGMSTSCSGSPFLHDYSWGTCTREDMAACERVCMMPGNVLDLNCYEECIYSTCRR